MPRNFRTPFVAIDNCEPWKEARDGSALLFSPLGATHAGRADHHLEDTLIAATALVRDLIVATRSIADFKPFGVELINPFLPRPKSEDI